MNYDLSLFQQLSATDLKTGQVFLFEGYSLGIIFFEWQSLFSWSFGSRDGGFFHDE